MSAVAENVQSAAYVDFWNQILVPKFIKYKHILVDGLTHHSEPTFPSLPVKEGDRVLDIGCGFGDTAIKPAQRVGPSEGIAHSPVFAIGGKIGRDTLSLSCLPFSPEPTLQGDCITCRPRTM
jgi:SAM-dependent methyltransferase